MKIKPIETIYSGYRFRSRLEARWAVFFDTLGIKYDYEMEGFDLGDKIYYLPDFWLPDLNMFAEVKPIPLTLEELEKCIRLAVSTNKHVMMLVAPPMLKWYEEIVSTPHTLDCFTSVEKREMSIKHGYDSVDDMIHAYRYIVLDSPIFCDGDDVIDAVYKARSARFEFDR